MTRLPIPIALALSVIAGAAVICLLTGGPF